MRDNLGWRPLLSRRLVWDRYGERREIGAGKKNGGALTLRKAREGIGEGDGDEEEEDGGGDWEEAAGGKVFLSLRWGYMLGDGTP